MRAWRHAPCFAGTRTGPGHRQSAPSSLASALAAVRFPSALGDARVLGRRDDRRGPLWIDSGLVRAGLRLFDELPRRSSDDVVLATDLRAGNVLRAQREPWLAIDPKPFVGDRAYDATQHLCNCKERMRTAPGETILRFADLLEIDDERIRMWMFARAAAEPRERWDDEAITLATALQ